MPRTPWHTAHGGVVSQSTEHRKKKKKEKGKQFGTRSLRCGVFRAHTSPSHPSSMSHPAPVAYHERLLSERPEIVPSRTPSAATPGSDGTGGTAAAAFASALAGKACYRVPAGPRRRPTWPLRAVVTLPHPRGDGAAQHRR